MKLIRSKDIKVNSKRVCKDVKLSVGDFVQLYFSTQKFANYTEIFKDENILVIDKKSGFTSEEIFESLSEIYSEIYFIHRLDRNTSGVMIFALNSVAEKELLDGFKNHNFIKEYLAEVVSKPPKNKDVLTAYLVKDSENSIVRISAKKIDKSVEIKTGYELIKTLEFTSILRVRLYTGKTHQIRAHLAFIGCAILGDGKYGDYEINRRLKAKTQHLIAKYLTLKFEQKSPLYYLNEKQFLSEQKLGGI